jgi:hypothetical protein
MSYYDLNRPYTIGDWNSLIRDVNDKLENPPDGEGCNPIDPIDEVSDPHIWSVDDIEVVRNKLIETCPDISFSEPMELWTPDMIDEIANALGETWCDCCDDDWLHEEQGTEIPLISYDAAVYVTPACFGYVPMPSSFPLSSIIDGMQVGKSGIEHRRWTVWQMPIEGYTPPLYFYPWVRARGEISCKGQIEYDGPVTVPGGWGAGVICSAGCNEYCQNAIDAAEASIADYGPLVWYIQITTSSAECADCDE